MKPKLLIIDDDETILKQLKWGLAEDYEVFTAANGEAALRLFRREKTPLVALDLGLPPSPRDAAEGLRILCEILTQRPGTKVTIITGNMEKANALKAVEMGAYDYFSKPVDLIELRTILRRALHLYHLERENTELQRNLAVQPFGEMLGQSESMEKIFSAIRKVAKADVPVMITGESGTGKELIARAIHQESHRKEAPFVVINCGAIPVELLESELFGHEKGAFTGAHLSRKGKIEFAQGGTLFLDEIGEMPLALQVKLLRFLQDFQIEHVGGREAIQVDTRIVTATNADVSKMIHEGKFREDLYYRLSVVVIAVPPLRERGADLLLLAKVFFERYVKEHGKKIKGFSKDAYGAIKTHSWGGNVRELENRIKRAVIMTEGRRITADDLALHVPQTIDHVSLRDTRSKAERDRILEAMACHGGNISQTASELGISRPALYDLMEKLGIER